VDDGHPVDVALVDAVVADVDIDTSGAARA
jgi:hypothetical protein